jgi:predicted nucleotidyltransferase
MAQGNMREYLRGDIVWQKKYFYVLRPLLAMLWIERGFGPAPIEFERLLEATVHSPNVRHAIDELLVAKKSGAELDRGPKIPEISRFIEEEVTRLERTAADKPNPTPSLDELNDLFRDILEEAWNNGQPA